MTLEESREVIPLMEKMISQMEEQQELLKELYQEMELLDGQLLESQSRNQELETENQQWRELAENLNKENNLLQIQIGQLRKQNSD